MTLNVIPERQNQPQFIRLLRARSEAYRRAVQLQVIQINVTVCGPVVCAIIGLIVPQARPYVAMAAIAITFIDIVVLDRIMKQRLKTAALICEEFDCQLLDMPWDQFVAGNHPDPETIIEADRHWPNGDSKLLDWYPSSVGSAPMYLARIICQRTNLWYDGTLRERYVNILLSFAVLITAVLIIIGVASDLPIDDFVVTILVPCSPLLSWALRDAFKQHDAANAQKLARSQAESLWNLAISGNCSQDECARQSREFQNTIFQRRVTNPLIFPMLYRCLRSEMETDMNQGAKALLKEVGITEGVSVPSQSK